MLGDNFNQVGLMKRRFLEQLLDEAPESIGTCVQRYPNHKRQLCPFHNNTFEVPIGITVDCN